MTEPPDDDLPPRTEQIPVPPSRRRFIPPEPAAGGYAAPPAAGPAADEGYDQDPPAAQAWPGDPTMHFSWRDPSAAAPLQPYPASSDPGLGSDGASTLPLHHNGAPGSSSAGAAAGAPAAQPASSWSPPSSRPRPAVIPGAGGSAGAGGPGAAAQPAAGYGQPGGPAGPAGPARNAVKIGLWGSSEAGKTTFLAALRHSVGADGAIRGRRGPGRWGIMPMNPESAELMVRFGQLLVQGKFPESTTLNAIVPLQWLFVGDIEKSRFDRRLIKRGRLESKFLLDLVDVNGEAFADDPVPSEIPARVSEQTIDHLTEAAGLIYLFDPLGEKDKRNAAQYVNRTVVELQRRYADKGHNRPYLPHNVAVCITKCDDTRVFQRARDLGFVNEGPDGAQWIRDEHAEQFFDVLCSGTFWSELDEAGHASATFVRKTLRGAFDPRKVSYHVTSSIGFRQPGGFDPDDYANYHEKAEGKPSIRGAINPINVLEPLVGLVQRIERQRVAP